MSKQARLYVILVTLTCVIITSLEILDATIVSVALHTMRGSLGATVDQMSWTMTAYIVAAAMTMPLTGFLASRFGRRRLMMFAIIGFGVASMLCGFATDITEIVILRFIQGAIGSLLGPLSQSLLVETFDKEDLGKAMAFYGVALMSAPIAGPILGAVVTNSLGWRWDFFINMPVCIVAVFAVLALVPKTQEKKRVPIDWLGMFWMVAAIGAFEYVLNRGNRLQWFDANQIVIVSVIAIFAFIVFLIHSKTYGRRNIVNLTLLKDRNFRTSLLMMVMFAMCYISINAWIPTLLEQLLHYPILTAGETLIPKGLGSVLSMALVGGFLMKRIASRYLLAIGFIFFAIGSFMFSRFTLGVNQHFFLIANLLQGASTGFFFVPLSSLAYQNIRGEDRDMASGLFNFSRSIGASLGIAIFSNIVNKQMQVNWHSLGSHLTPTSANMKLWLTQHHLNLHSAALPATLAKNLQATASQFAYNDAFLVATIVILCLLPFVFLLDKSVLSPKLNK